MVYSEYQTSKAWNKWQLLAISLAAAFAIVVGLFAAKTFAVDDANITVTPASSGAENVVGVAGDSAPGFSSGSIASTGAAAGSGKSEFYFTSQSLFGRNVPLGDIASMSYWTKKDTTHTAVPADWFLNIYTDPYVGDVSSATWYGDRIGAEPYFSQNLADPVNTWNKWSTDGAQNKLRFFESTNDGYFGGYDDQTWSGFYNGTALSNQPYATRTVKFFSIQTATAWANGFTGKVDGLQITLTDGTVRTVNFEANAAPAPVVNGENFNTHSSTDYQGVNVGYNIANFDTVTSTTVSLLDANRKVIVTNTGTQDLFDLYNEDDITQFSTPFITSVGTYDVANDTYWQFGKWTSNAKPVYAVITVNGVTTEITPLTEPNGILFSNLVFATKNKEDCKNNGYGIYGFKNQGQCVASIESNSKSKLNR